MKIRRRLYPATSYTLVSFALLLGTSIIRPAIAFLSIYSSQRQDSSRLAAIIQHSPVVVALTREEGKNDKLAKQIQSDVNLSERITLLDLPCIAHASGPDYDRLGSTLTEQSWDYVAVTSPEAANVLASVWDAVRASGAPLPSVIAVGKATEKVLQKNDISVAFVPSIATAETLAEELKLKSGQSTTTLLYPASARAKTTLQDGLSQRGFEVTRLNTYDTVTATWTESQKNSAKTVQVACFASPSSIKGWLHNTDQNQQVLAACIGITSATACKELGWKDEHIFYPEAPGMEGWINSIQDAMEAAQQMAHDKTETVPKV
jgi:uroporphyrinogen-III synthase